MNTDKHIAAPKAQNKTAQDVFLKRDLGVGSFGLRRQAERDAAFDQAGRLGCPHKSAVAAALCQRSPKAPSVSRGFFSWHLSLTTRSRAMPWAVLSCAFGAAEC
jgi:hypothetical protein